MLHFAAYLFQKVLGSSKCITYTVGCDQLFKLSVFYTVFILTLAFFPYIRPNTGAINKSFELYLFSQFVLFFMLPLLCFSKFDVYYKFCCSLLELIFAKFLPQIWSIAYRLNKPVDMCENYKVILRPSIVFKWIFGLVSKVDDFNKLPEEGKEKRSSNIVLHQFRTKQRL